MVEQLMSELSIEQGDSLFIILTGNSAWVSSSPQYRERGVRSKKVSADEAQSLIRQGQLYCGQRRIWQIRNGMLQED